MGMESDLEQWISNVSGLEASIKIYSKLYSEVRIYKEYYKLRMSTLQYDLQRKLYFFFKSKGLECNIISLRKLYSLKNMRTIAFTVNFTVKSD